MCVCVYVCMYVCVCVCVCVYADILSEIHGYRLEQFSGSCVGLAVLRDAVSQVWPSSEPLVEGIFPLELTWVLTLSPNTLLDESIYQGIVGARVHSIVKKILRFMS